MQASAKVRAARKKMQEDRLAQKGSEGYTQFYANQPLQKVKAQRNAEKKAAQRALREAQENLQIAEITGDGLKAAQEAVQSAALSVHKLNLADSAPGSVLTAGA